MSKLSESVKAMQDEDKKKNLEEHFTTDENKAAFMKALYEKISNVEFNVLQSSDAFYIEVYPFMNFDKTLVVKIKKARTTSYEIGLFPNGKQAAYLVGKYPINVDAIGTEEDGYVDIGELVYYCEKTAKDFHVAKEKSTLNKEIDEGFKNPKNKSDGSGRMSLGGETLEEDVAFNEWMHKRFK